MNTKKTARGTNSVLLVAIVLSLIVLINLFAQRFFFRVDLTADRQYTLTAATRKVVSELDDVVNIKMYFSDDLPTYLVTLRQQIEDTLDEYKAWGKENLLIEWEDPGDDPEMQRRCQVLGIPRVQLNIIEKDKAQVANAYLGMAILYEDRSEVIPVVQSVENLEYDLTAALLKVYREERETVGVIAGPDDLSLSEGLTAIAELLGRQYTVVDVDPDTGEPIGADVRTLLIVRPDQMTRRGQFEIDQFVMRGGNILLFHDPISMGENSMVATARESGMHDLLAHYGIDVGRNLVLDRVNTQAAFSQGFITFRIPYPFWPKIAADGVSRSNPIVNQLEGIVLPWTSSVAAAPQVPEGVKVDTLLSTSPYGWIMSDRFNLNPQQAFPDQPRDPVEPLPIAAVASGTFPSYFAGGEVPPVEGVGTIEGEEAPAVNRDIIETGVDARVVVLGSGNAALDDMLSQFPANTLLLQNAVDWLTLGDDLISIRSRGATDRPLKELSENRKTILRFLVTLGIPVLVVLFGLVRSVHIKNRRSAMSEGVNL